MNGTGRHGEPVRPWTKSEVLARIERSGLIAVIRAGSLDEARRLTRAVRDGGIDVVEVTFTVPGAAEFIRELVSGSGGGLVVGAGTVLRLEQAREALDAGAGFLVSPGLNPEVVRYGAAAGVLTIPGCMTITEVLTALEAGADAIKLFPADVVGPGFVRALRGPLPRVKVIPTGGVGAHNAAEWLKAGCPAVGVGGELTGAPDVARAARELVLAVRQARQA